MVNLSLIETINLYESEHLNQANEIKEELLSMLKEIGGTDKDKFASKCSNIINEVFYQISFSSQKEKSNLLLDRYKDELLQLIYNLETINEGGGGENLNFSVCNELVKEGILKLSSMPKNPYIDLILQHYLKWKNILNRL